MVTDEKYDLLKLASRSQDTHKNIEIFLPLARLIRKLGRNYRLIITIDKGQNASGDALLKSLHDEQLDDLVINVGSVQADDVPALYRKCDALLMPTMLETFGLPYVEAMNYGVPILTSDLPFAHDVCGDAACYFDPNSAEDILSKIESVFKNPVQISSLKEAGFRRLALMPSLSEFFTMIQVSLQRTMARAYRG